MTIMQNYIRYRWKNGPLKKASLVAIFKFYIFKDFYYIPEMMNAI